MSGTRQNAPRYRRRILTLGLLAALVLFSVGFPIVNNRIEADLERRVPAELAEAGFTGVTASFSGQDGTLRCAQPLADPEAATEAAYDVWGVRTITLDRRCRVNRAPTIANGDDTGTSGEASATESGVAAETTLIAGQEFATIVEAVMSEPSLAFLASLLDDAGWMATLADPGAPPVTLFAPTDAAFDGLPPDVTAELRSDPALLARVLGHHVVGGARRSTDLTPGVLDMMDGGSVLVAVGSTEISIDDATLATPDLVTGNGIVHVIDRVLLPVGFDIGAGAPAASVAATLSGGRFVLTGVVASEVERATLVDTATIAADADGVIGVVDELSVDPNTGLKADVAGDLAVLMSPMPGSLVSGVAGFDGTTLYLTGVAISGEAATAITAIASAVGVEADIEARPEATEGDAARLEEQLNEFVDANPIRFEPNSAVLTADASDVLDQLATFALEFAGVEITVEGHTDTDGNAAANLTLSQLRADAVRLALASRGLDADAITAQGFGEQRPVLSAGIEDKDASRRVEFRIEATL
jgi:outer membrane protein OmpA-like peptidoglycan-associated protein/uncharacterized surface protein with fasciclin (FAS1) repeats